MAMSISTTSGWSFLASATACRPSLRLADDFEIVLEFEHLAETFAHDHVIFRQAGR
jgi:hypothetical protein